MLLTGAMVGLCVSLAGLTLMWFGVSGVLNIGHADLMYAFWPSSWMLTVGWRSTPLGMAITVGSVVVNCLLYLAVAYGFRRVLTTSGW